MPTPLETRATATASTRPDRRVHTVVDSPIGPLLLIADDGQLIRLAMLDDAEVADSPDVGVRDDAALAEARAQLAAYFAGERQEFDLPLRLAGTDFQRRVWAALREIPYGSTLSYGALAARVGTPGGSRAVGLANGRNPVAVIVPCHRVIAADGALGGYGGGLERKRTLLELEQRVTGQRLL